MDQKADNKHTNLKKKDATEVAERFDQWYESVYSETVGIEKFNKKLAEHNVWLAPHFKKFLYPFSSIWRNHILLSINASTFPNKVDYVTTIFRLYRPEYVKSKAKKKSASYKTSYAILYSVNNKHEYVVLDSTYKSADGEYRRNFIPYDQIGLFMKYSKKYYLQFLKHIEQYDLSFENITIGGKVNITDDLSYVLYFCTWIIGINEYVSDRFSNHVADGFVQTMYAENDISFYKSMAEEWGINTGFGSALLFLNYIRTTDVNDKGEIAPQHVNIKCGQKIIPLHVKEIEQVGEIKHKTWKELYIGKLVGDLCINGISAAFPIFGNWFLIKANEKSLYDNAISHIKFDHSLIADDIVKQLEQSRRGTYTYDNNEEVYLSVSMETLSGSIEYPMKYAEKEIVMSPYALCVVNEYVGSTFADYSTKLRNEETLIYEIGNIFGDYMVFSKYIFEYIYGFYCMNYHLGIIHSDVHLNNITLYLVKRFRDPVHQKTFIDSAYIVYDMSDHTHILDIYMVPHYGRYSNIIDFSRVFLSEEHVKKIYPAHKADEYISLQRTKMMKIWNAEFPDYMTKNSATIESASFSNYDTVHKIFTAYDTYKMTKSMKVLLKAEGHTLTPECNELLDKLIDISQSMLTHDFPVTLQKIKNDPEFYPNCYIIRECFKHLHINSYSQSGTFHIVDYFKARNHIKYSTTDKTKFPPNILYDDIQKAGFTVTKDLVYKRYQNMDKYLKTHDPEKEIAKISEAIAAEEPKRRGKPTIQDQKKFMKDVQKIIGEGN